MNVLIIFIGIVIIAILLHQIFKVIKWLQFRSALNKIPGPYSYYIVGNVADLAGSSEKLFQKSRKITSLFKISRLWMAYIGLVIITTPEDIEVVIASTENLEKSRIYEGFQSWLQNGLLNSGGRKWHHRRKILTPAFHFNILLQFTNIFVRHANALTEDLFKNALGKSVDVEPYVIMYTLNSICETAMGIKLDMKIKRQEEYKDDVFRFGELLIYRISRPWLYEKILYVFSPAFWYERKTASRLHKFSHDVIEARKKNFTGSITNKIDDLDFISKKRLAMLDLLLSAKEDGAKIDDAGIQEEVDTFLFEGHDTTAVAICFTLMLLANHREQQDKIYQEIIEILGDGNAQPAYSDLMQMRYLEMCIKESMRLYPSVPIIGRVASKDVHMPSGYTIPKGANIHVHIYDLHRNSDVYPDPEKFDPERFLPENTSTRHPFSYLPFSGGPRNCIGQKFAMLELKAVVSAIVRKFILEPVDTPESITLLQQMLLKSKNGIRVRFMLRNTNEVK